MNDKELGEAILETMGDTSTQAISLKLDDGQSLNGYPMGYDMNNKDVFLDFYEQKKKKKLKIKIKKIKKFTLQ